MTMNMPNPNPRPVQVASCDILEWLKKACRGLVENGVITSDRVAERALSLAEDINRIEFSSFGIIGLREHKFQIGLEEVIIPLVEYSFGETRQNINNASPQQTPDRMAKIRNMEGTGLNCEDLAYFARVSEIGRRCVPGLWLGDDALRNDLRAPQKHIPTLNEVWWLNLWPGLDQSRVIREAKINPPGESSVDWKFPIRNTDFLDCKNDFTVHLELKQIFTSLEAQVHGDHAAPLKDIFQGVDGKFRCSSDCEINIVGVTLFCEITPMVEEQVKTRLRDDPLIDAVILWVPNSRHKQFCVFYNDVNSHGCPWKKTALKMCLQEPSIEDRGRIFFNKHPLIELNQRIHRPSA
jgi:hypothetical protein